VCHVTYFYLYNVVQNYFRDPWNVFDFITVIGSVTDVLLTEVYQGVHEVMLHILRH